MRTPESSTSSSTGDQTVSGQTSTSSGGNSGSGTSVSVPGASATTQANLNEIMEAFDNAMDQLSQLPPPANPAALPLPRPVLTTSTGVVLVGAHAPNLPVSQISMRPNTSYTSAFDRIPRRMQMTNAFTCTRTDKAEIRFVYGPKRDYPRV